ncbi:hypothetical protein [Streptomyces sp. NPDC020983]|uniref:hypothetical protein n=1 Tax=Streptomyces sp. NPDC020983 TaxID=3365106 RepID=UPI003794F273
MARASVKEPADFGPQQFPDRLGLRLWEFQRALDDGLIPLSDVAGGRWSAAVVAAAAERLGEIRAAVGTLPDVGAWRAAELLAERFGVEVSAETVMELGRKDIIPVSGEYKGNALYDGRALERFADRRALAAAAASGRLHTKDSAAGYLRVRPADVEHLVRAGWLTEVHRVHSSYQPRKAAPAVALFRQGDLDVLLAHPAIDWDDVRATPKGRPSALAKLTASRAGR